MSSADFSAKPSALGYLYQARCALLWLLDSGDDAEVSLEKSDDVTFEKDGTPEEKLQLKHHISRTAALTDTSADLWKTIRIWAEDISSSRLGENTKLTLVTTGIAPAGSIAAVLKSCDMSRDEASVLARMNLISENSKNKELEAAFASFKILSVAQRQDLLRRIRVLDSVEDIQDVGREIEKRLRIAATANRLQAFTSATEGWWYRRIITHWTNNDRGIISRAELDNALADIRDQFRRDALPVDFPQPIKVDESSIPQKERFFVEQLRKVRAHEALVRDALSDYRRAFEQRSKWLREDLIFQPELDEYNERLVEEWRLLFYPAVQDSEGAEATMKEKSGFALYCALQQRDLPIRPGFSYAYLMRGSYHTLANVPRVCWHPDLQDTLVTEVDQNGGAKP